MEAWRGRTRLAPPAPRPALRTGRARCHRVPCGRRLSPAGARPRLTTLRILPTLDDDTRAAARRLELDLPLARALTFARETLAITRAGGYRTPTGRSVTLAESVRDARRAKVSLAPDASLPAGRATPHDEMRIQVANETATAAARRLGDPRRTVVLNFANGVVPGGGFVHGACAQEESLCRASALFETLRDDPMYERHAQDGGVESSDHAILSPGVPFFRDDTGALLEEPYALAVVTCAAPIASACGPARAGGLLRGRIGRVLAIMAAYRYEAVVLGAWGCGAFGGDPRATAADFRDALAGPFRGAFRDVVFAIADWSPERRLLGPFRDTLEA